MQTGRCLALISLLLAALALNACRGERLSPEDQIRARISLAVTAAEQKDLGTLRDMISDQFRDEQGQDRRAVENILRVHFLRNESLHFLTRVVSVTLASPDRAEAVVLAAMAGVPITSEADLPGLRADLHRFEISFVREDKTWRVRHAAWRRADPGEFISP